MDSVATIQARVNSDQAHEMETLPKRTVVETLEASEDYARHLESLLNAVKTAESQVEQSAVSASQEVEATFESLKDNILVTLEDRKKALLGAIQLSQQEAIGPLRQCREDIADKLTKNKQLILDTKAVLKSGGFKSPEKCNDFVKHSAALGVLPAVPEIELVPNITFQSSVREVIPDLIEIINSFGKVYKIGPVQITSTDPKPGALLVRWEDVDFDFAVDIQSYRLQMSVGDGSGEHLFSDVYIGPETEFLITNLKYQQSYSFRVCCNSSGSTAWSSWSLVKTSSTNVPPFNWINNNPNFCVSDDNRLARAVSPGSVLFSRWAQVRSGNSVQFTVLSQMEPLIEEGVGLTVSDSIPTLLHSGAFFVSFHGEVYIDGTKKIICLPKMGKGSKVIFCCELVNTKWRITVECGAKAVTYEWATNSHHLFFATSLSQPDVQVLVE